jgi:hypothetical protein
MHVLSNYFRLVVSNYFQLGVSSYFQMAVYFSRPSRPHLLCGTPYTENMYSNCLIVIFISHNNASIIDTTLYSGWFAPDFLFLPYVSVMGNVLLLFGGWDCQQKRYWQKMLMWLPTGMIEGVHFSYTYMCIGSICWEGVIVKSLGWGKTPFQTRLKILPVLTREHYTSLLHWV